MKTYIKKWKNCRYCPRELCRNLHYYNYLIIGENFTFDAKCTGKRLHRYRCSVELDTEFPMHKQNLKSVILGLLKWPYLTFEDALMLSRFKKDLEFLK